MTLPYANSAVNKLNDLIYAKKYIWANRYYESKIYKINPSNGKVVSIYSMEELVEHETQQKTLTQSRLNSGYVFFHSFIEMYFTYH